MPEQVPVRSVRTGGIDHLEEATPQEAYVAALRREREGYVRYGKTDRAAAVTAELRRFGAETAAVSQCPEQPRPPTLENTADSTPRQRTATRGRPRNNP
ncbi:hypothetical protein AB0B89_27210 [Sphaerisporangium sp. NPDC049002]|uniref:hypothetical protein n=1 Tax=Sphaerisporangium sp. NPDC049002 TaxID=3155392 RepID=UPI003410267A